ncbi:MAG: putative enoyl-CoA hydratase EchA13 [Acidimicrobiales bacterium]|nr:MAG: enoyl-CoA hydratase [Actinomycetota bacterium]MBV6509128.1 putative enoyl-CoA hydratase EchA13 [Acidimicrobiales bacterium]RIK08521.1 MAG: enoyl-CoA hydratase [Acidobacteriota bacterium]
MSFHSITYEVDDRVATITLNRPDRLNAIDLSMPAEIAAAVELANSDRGVHVIVVSGAGRAFCAGYDLQAFAEIAGTGGTQGAARSEDGAELPWDPMLDFTMMHRNTIDFMSLWRSHKPTIAKVRGYAVAGGSDIALCCDLVVIAEDAMIGYPPARVWGCPTTAMWAYRIGAERAKRMLFTGDLITGREAADIGLVLEAVPPDDLDARVAQIADRVKGVPRNQLMMQKLMVNHAIEAMGLNQTQVLATLFDGITRHTPEGEWFKRRAEEVGFKQAVRERDSGENIAQGWSR